MSEDERERRKEEKTTEVEYLIYQARDTAGIRTVGQNDLVPFMEVLVEESRWVGTLSPNMLKLYEKNPQHPKIQRSWNK